MKIIGTTKNGFVVEATRAELANVAGFDNYYALSQHVKQKSGEEIPLKTGDEIQVSEVFKRAGFLKRNEGKFEELAGNLKTIAKELEIQESLIISIEAEDNEQKV